MFTTKKVTHIKGNTVRTESGTPLSANLSSSTGASVSAFGGSNWNYLMSGLLPATPDQSDNSNLALMYRDIYLMDSIGGSVVDLMSVFPFSDWELRGVEEKYLSVFENALTRLNIRDMLPQISISNLVDGFHCGSLVYDPEARNFMDLLVHDALQCNVIPSPFANIDPSIRVTTSGPTLQFLESSSDYAKKYIQNMPHGFKDLIKSGAFTLDPLTTLWVARKGLSDRAYQSYMHRLLPMYLLEKSMYRGTLTEATRRQRAMTHITAGDDIWTPTSEELRTLVQQFQDAERDPLGGWITTRNAVQAQDLRPGGDFWKWTEMADAMTPMKLRALGISEAFLSGDASFASAQNSYSVFLETANGYRTSLTNSIFYKKVFPILAVANGLFKDGKNKKNIDPVEFLFNGGNRNLLIQPTVHWHKDLSGEGEQNMMELLEKLTEHNVPIPLKMWIAAAGIDKDTLIRDAKEDKALREALGSNDTSAAASEADAENGIGGPEGLTTASVSSPYARKPVGILNRHFADDVGLGKTGKPVYAKKSPGAKRDSNWQIAKVAASLADTETRNRVKQGNLQNFGTDVLKGF